MWPFADAFNDSGRQTCSVSLAYKFSSLVSPVNMQKYQVKDCALRGLPALLLLLLLFRFAWATCVL